jgi:hypothetical protein
VPEVAPQAHAAILREIRAAQADVDALSKSTKPKNGYMGFELAKSTLAGLHSAVNDTKDQAALVTMLKGAFAQLRLVAGGDVAPAIERARVKFKEILDTLQPKKGIGVKAPPEGGA